MMSFLQEHEDEVVTDKGNMLDDPSSTDQDDPEFEKEAGDEDYEIKHKPSSLELEVLEEQEKA